MLHIDLMYIDKQAYLLSVSTPMGLLSVNHLGAAAGAKAAKSLKVALLDQMTMFQRYGYKITDILTDGEGAVAKITVDLARLSVVVNTAGPGEHVPLIERKIRQVKERVRGILNTLPYRLAGSLLHWLVSFAVTRINLMPSKTGYINVSAREVLTGRKVSYDRDVRVGFGDYVQAVTRVTNNSMTGRTDGAIALCPTMNQQGSCSFLLLSSKEVVVRDHWTALPTPADVIQQMNEYADKEGSAVGKNVEVRRGEVLIVEVEETVIEGEIVEESGQGVSIEEIFDEGEDAGAVSHRGDGAIDTIMPHSPLLPDSYSVAMGHPLIQADASYTTH
jgi:hypothetical protein